MINFKILVLPLLLFLISCTNPVKAEEVDENHIVWKKSDSPIIIDSLFTVGEHQTLTIEPGVEIRLKSEIFYTEMEIEQGFESPFSAWDLLHIESPKVGMISIKGTFLAEGDKENPIIFTRQNEGFWGSIFVDRAKNINMEYCTIEYSSGSISSQFNYRMSSIFINECSGSIQNCTIQNYKYNAVDLVNCLLFRIKNNTIDGYSSIFTRDSHIVIENNLLLNCSRAILLQGYSVSYVVNNTFINPGDVFTVYSRGMTRIMNNIIFDIVKDGRYLSLNSIAGYAFENNLVTYQDHEFDTIEGNNWVSIDPYFVDEENGDFRLRSDSPLINIGTTDVEGYQFPETDLYGNPRIVGAGIDLGCSEVQSNK